jgi:hypothetical protein
MSTVEKVDLVKEVFNRYNRSAKVQELLSKPYFAPYLLVQLIERSTYMRMVGDFEVFKLCL